MSATLQQAPRLIDRCVGECPLTTSPLVSPPRSDTFAVTPVAEYEPPTRNVQNVPQYRPSSHATLRRRTPCAPRQHGSSHPEAATAARRRCHCPCAGRQSSPTPLCAECWKSSTADVPRPSCGRCWYPAWSTPWSQLAGPYPDRQSDREPDTKQPRCCAGCVFNPSGGTIRTPQRRFSVRTVAGTASTPSRAAWNRCSQATARDGRWLPCT